MTKYVLKIMSLFVIGIITTTSCEKSTEAMGTESKENPVEIQSSLTRSDMIAVQKSIITRFYGAHRRAEEELPDSIAQEIFSPLVADGAEIVNQIQEAVETGDIAITPEEAQQLAELTDEQLAELSFVVYTLNDPALMNELYSLMESNWEANEPFSLDDPTAFTRGEITGCSGEAFGFSAVSSFWSYITGTAGLITARTALQLATAFAGRTLGWVGLAIAAYDFGSCLHSKQKK